MLNETTADILYALGFEPEWVEGLGYLISLEGTKLICLPEERQQTISVMLPQVFELTETNRMAVLESMAALCGELKYVQTSIVYDNVWLNYEHYLGEDMPGEKLLTHMIRVLAAAREKFLSIISDITVGHENK